MVLIIINTAACFSATAMEWGDHNSVNGNQESFTERREWALSSRSWV